MKRTFILLFLSVFFIFGVMAQSAQDLYNLYQDLTFFDSPMALKLKKGVKERDVAKIKNPSLRDVASLLLKGEYDESYRFSRYEAVLDPTVLGQQLGIGDGYSKYENVTGVYLPKGQHIVLVDGIKDQPINLVVPNWLRMAPEGIDPTRILMVGVCIRRHLHCATG